MNIAGNDGNIIVFVDQKTFITSLVEVAAPLMATIVMGCIGNIEMTHELAKITEGRFKQKMKMVGHQDKTVQGDIVCFEGAGQDFQKSNPVDIILENSLSLIATVRDMINCAGKLDAKRPCHMVKLLHQTIYVNYKDLTPPLIVSPLPHPEYVLLARKVLVMV